jgi:hypothetical protein
MHITAGEVQRGQDVDQVYRGPVVALDILLTSKKSCTIPTRQIQNIQFSSGMFALLDVAILGLE